MMTVETQMVAEHPSWVNEQPKQMMWSFINSYGDKWFARMEQDQLIFTSQVLKWKDIRLSEEQIENEYDRLAYQRIVHRSDLYVDGKREALLHRHPLTLRSWDKSETYWLLSVLSACHMKRVAI